MKANILQNHYYFDSYTPINLKVNRIKLQKFKNFRNVESPEPLRIEKLKFTPLLRTRTTKNKTNIRYIDKNYSDSNHFISENFNNYIKTHALTNLSPADFINHYKIDNGKKQVEAVSVPTVNKVYYENPEVLDFPMKNWKKIEQELFETHKKEKKSRPIIKLKTNPAKNLKIVGNPLN